MKNQPYHHVSVDKMNPTTVRIALAAVRFPGTPDESITLACQAIDDAAARSAAIVCFPECFVPGYRGPTTSVPPPDAEFLDRAWAAIAAAAERRRIAVVLGTERVADNGLVPAALVIDADGSFAGFQDKNQIDPSEESTYAAGVGRRVFRSGGVKFGVVICHEGWRYPETVRCAARRHAARASSVWSGRSAGRRPGSHRRDRTARAAAQAGVTVVIAAAG
jgi:predicted amidohydrolase